MRTIVGVLTVAAATLGFLRGDMAGAATGAVVWIAIATSLVVLTGRGTQEGIAPLDSPLGFLQRFTAVLMIGLVLVGTARGGWRWGWLGAVAGYGTALVLGFILRLIMLRKTAIDKSGSDAH